jgi:hypothetical protein
MSDIVYTSPITDLVVYGASHIRDLVVYEPRPIKRLRSTRDQVTERRRAIYEIVKAQRPMTVRQVFYQATVHKIVEKEETGYSKVQNDLMILRKSGAMPYDWLADNTRWTISPTTFSSIDDALEHTARRYRKSLWDDIGCRVEIWIEKDALASVINEVTNAYDVPVMVARGFSSETFLYNTAQALAAHDVPVFVYHLGDFDPSGRCAAEKIEAGLRHHAPDAEIHFECLAVNMDQIIEWNLATRPTKQSDSRAKGFGDISCELDAIAPDMLRGIALEAINRHLPETRLRSLLAEQADDKAQLHRLVQMFLDGEIEV